MLDLAKVTPKDVVIDLGSGDGRNVIAAAKRGARAIGVEYNPDLVELSRQHARDAGVSDKATFVQGDMYKADISQATVLGPLSHAGSARPDARQVSGDETRHTHRAQYVFRDRLGTGCHREDRATLHGVVHRPPRHRSGTVAGTWRMNDAQMILRQDFQFVKGTIGAQPVTGRLRGDEIALTSGGTEYKGRVTGDRIEGSATIAGRQMQWIATKD